MAVVAPGNCACLFCSWQGITLVSSQAVSNAKKMGWPLKEVTAGVFETEAPGGYKFYLEDKEQLKQGETYTLALLCVLKRFVSGVLELAVHLSLAFYGTGMYFYYFSVTFLLKNVKPQVYNCDVFVTNPQLLQSYRSCAEGNLGRLRSA